MRVGTGRPGAYSLADGSTPLSASQVAKHLGDPEPLTRWAVEMSRKGRDPFRHRDEAADVGTAVHAAIVAYLTGHAHETLLWDAAEPVAAERAFAAWLRWWTTVAGTWTTGGRGEPVAAEWPMVSERMRLGGTMDLLARTSPVGLWVYDWKGCGARSELTGRWKPSVYRDQHVIQAALYGLLWRDSDGHGEVPNGCSIVYIPRDDGEALEVRVTDADWLDAMADAEALVPIVQRHVERSKRYAAMARPMPALEPVDMDAPVDFGP